VATPQPAPQQTLEQAQSRQKKQSELKKLLADIERGHEGFGMDRIAKYEAIAEHLLLDKYREKKTLGIEDVSRAFSLAAPAWRDRQTPVVFIPSPVLVKPNSDEGVFATLLHLMDILQAKAPDGSVASYLVIGLDHSTYLHAKKVIRKHPGLFAPILLFPCKKYFYFQRNLKNLTFQLLSTRTGP